MVTGTLDTDNENTILPADRIDGTRRMLLIKANPFLQINLLFKTKQSQKNWFLFAHKFQFDC